MEFYQLVDYLGNITCLGNSFAGLFVGAERNG